MSVLDKIDQLYDGYAHGEMTWQELKRFEQAFIADCTHERVARATDEDDITCLWCVDCGEEL